MGHTVITTMVDVNCANCGLLFSVTSDFRDRRKKDHKYFYCPNKHHNYWPQESDEEKLKRELEAMTNDRNFQHHEADHLRKSRAAIKGKVTKMKKRIANGVCPCCNRTFKNLARHMKGQHPAFQPK